jgi:hypothetical protein
MPKTTNSRQSDSDSQRELLRHTVATLAYRGEKAIRQVPPGFADFNAGKGLRTPRQILAHMGDLMDWALSTSRGQQKWVNSEPLPWDREEQRFFGSLESFDDFLASAEPLQAPAERLFQGPIADALTHVGQIAMLRHIAGEVLKAENYYVAEIEIGRVGADQPQPKYEF